MKIVIFGLTNGYRHDGGHRSRWRALIQALAIRGHRVVAVERSGPDAPTPWTIPGGDVLSYGASPRHRAVCSTIPKRRSA
jgi:hypothetical protein